MNVSTCNYRNGSTRRGSGFTLVELLVVITIIGVLISMLMPAVNAARESANRASCSNNIKQLALACLNYDQSWKALPCACTQTGTWLERCNGNGVQPQPTNQRENWVIMILPYIEQTALFNSFVEKFEENNANHANATAIGDKKFEHLREIELPVMKCPSDANNRIPYTYNVDNTKWARGNYGANMGLTLADYLGHDTWWTNTGARGVMGPRHSLSTGEISDGTSNTILLAELRSGLSAKDIRGTWSMGGAGSSATCRNGYICGDDNGPNYLVEGSDDIYQCSSSGMGIVSKERQRLKMPCGEGTNSNRQATTRSMHQAGVMTAFVDNSVHFISDNIQTRSSFGENETNVRNNTEFSVWDCINLSSDGKSINNADF